jgi:hypothetical protein
VLRPRRDSDGDLVPHRPSPPPTPPPPSSPSSAMSSSLTSSSSLSSPPSLRAGDVGYTEITPPPAVPLARRRSHSSLAYELRIRVLQLAQSGGWRTCPGGLLSCPESHVAAPNAGPIGFIERKTCPSTSLPCPSGSPVCNKRDCALNSAAIPLLRRGWASVYNIE